MPMTMPADTGGDFVLVPEGTHPARCYRVIDLGTQDTTFANTPKRTHQIQLGWEIASLTMDDGRPMVLGKRYTFSSNEKANLRKDLERWRGQRFKPEDLGKGGFDIKTILTHPCLLAVTHAVKGDNTYANVDSVAKLVVGMAEPPALINPPVFLGLQSDTWDQAAFASLSDKLQDAIRKSPEYQQLFSGQPAPQTGERTEDNFDDDLPF